MKFAVFVVGAQRTSRDTEGRIICCAISVELMFAPHCSCRCDAWGGVRILLQIPENPPHNIDASASQ